MRARALASAQRSMAGPERAPERKWAWTPLPRRPEPSTSLPESDEPTRLVLTAMRVAAAPPAAPGRRSAADPMKRDRVALPRVAWSAMEEPSVRASPRRESARAVGPQVPARVARPEPEPAREAAPRLYPST